MSRTLESRTTHLLKAVLAVVTVILIIVRPSQAPVPQFDEGWVMSVAHNLVTTGHYGQMRDGKPAPASLLNIGFPVVLPVALSFRMFGVGIWQARLPSMAYSLAAFAALIGLAKALYGTRIAIASWAILLFATPVTPVLWTRQVLGEAPMLLFTLLGFWSLLCSLRKGGRYWAIGPLLFALACLTKLQALPFISLSLLTPAVLALRARERLVFLILTACLVGTIGLYAGGRWAMDRILGYEILPGTGAELLSTTALAVSLPARRAALAGFLFYALPTGLSAISHTFSGAQYAAQNSEFAVVAIRTALWGFVSGWLGWYLLLSVGWERYLVAPTFVGSVLVAVMLSHWTFGFDLPQTIESAAACVGLRRTDRHTLGALAALVILGSGVALSTTRLAGNYLAPTDTSLADTIDYLNTSTPSDSLVETYQMELFPFLKRRYHYPPDDVQQQLNSRTWLGLETNIDYDPLSADPDYLVVGPLTSTWGLYDEAIAQGAFVLKREFPCYRVYTPAQ